MLHESFIVMNQHILHHTKNVHRRVRKKFKPVLTPICWHEKKKRQFKVQPLKSKTNHLVYRYLTRVFFHAWSRVPCFSALGHVFHVFPCLARVACFPAFGTGCMFSRVWHGLHVFPRLAHVLCLTRTWQGFHVFPHLARVASFSRAWHGLHVFPCLARIACFPALAVSNLFLPWLLIDLMRYMREHLITCYSTDHLLKIVAIISKQISWLFWNNLTNGKDRRAR